MRFRPAHDPRRRRAITYNFDADRWLANQRMALAERLRRGDIDEEGYLRAVEEVERRYDEMQGLYDRAFELPPVRPE